MLFSSKIEVDLIALQYNFNHIRNLAPHSKIIAMVKANAYGHGLIRIAKSLVDTDALGVSNVIEAEILRRSGIQKPIIVMSGVFNTEILKKINSLNCDVVIHQMFHIDLLKKIKLSRKQKIWIKVDTGMHRLGFDLDKIEEVFKRVQSFHNIDTHIGLMTHFSDADQKTNQKTLQQIRLFQESTKHLPGEKSLANSGGIINFPEAHADWVRPGIMLYGVSPIDSQVGEDLGLKPVMTFESQIIAINYLKKGDAIGYGSNWICPEDMLVGVVSVGYGDGYPRHATSGTPALVNDNICPLVGNVSMDMITVDLRFATHPKIGDRVVLWGKGLPVEKVAYFAKTIPYDLLTKITQRVAGTMNDYPCIGIT